jgi:putative hemolysin
MFRHCVVTALILVLCGLLLGCQTANVEKSDEPPTVVPTGGANLPNPAAVHCQEEGYTYEIRTAADGSQSGVCIFPDGSECDEWAFYRGECGPTQASTVPTTASLWLDKTDFEPGEEIQVHFAAPGTFPSDAWVGIIPSEVPHGSEATNDEYDLDYDYLDGQISGVLSFMAPFQPGSYDFRLHDTDEDGHEVASVTFKVVGGADKPELWLDKTTFTPGEEIALHFAVPVDFPDDAWVGIIPSEVPHGSETTNDEYDLDYDYLEGQVSGVLIFFAPDEPGSYDFRLHDTDDDGQEVASVTFQATGD